MADIQIMKILTAQQIKALDRENITQFDTPSIELMERASGVLCERLCEEYDTNTPFMVFAGPGNNGGDGLALSRMLGQKGYDVEVYLFNTRSALSDDCQTNKERLLETDGARLHEITTQFDLPKLSEGVVIVEALFGTGMSRPLAGGFRLLAEFINNSGHRVVSVDLPAGMMDVDTDTPMEADTVIVRADETFTFHCLKPCMLLADNQQYVGKLEVLDIGLNDSNIHYQELTYCATTKAEARQMIRPRDAFGHKGTFGHALMIAGSKGMAGASVLGARAALRSGLGKLTVGCPECNLQTLQVCVPECVVAVGRKKDAVSAVDLEEGRYDAVAFGSGVGQGIDAKEALVNTINQEPQRLIIDADGLNLLSQQNRWKTILPPNTILTPHRKEWVRLCGGRDMSDTALLQEARACAMECHIYIVLKGHYTMVCTPQGRVFFNVGGNSGMATAGSGDVLTGILLSLLAQGYGHEDACRLGVWLHACAGDMAANELSEESMVASDIVNHLYRAFQLLHEQ